MKKILEALEQIGLASLLGLSLSLSCSFLIESLTAVQRAETQVQKVVAELVASPLDEDKALILNITGNEPNRGIYGPDDYADLITYLLDEAQASAIVFNPPAWWEWSQQNTYEYEQFTSAVQEYENRLVIVASTSPLRDQTKQIIELDNRLVPISSSDFSPLVELKKIYGFFELVPSQTSDISNLAATRRFYPRRSFLRSDNFESIDLYNAAYLAYKKSGGSPLAWFDDWQLLLRIEDLEDVSYGLTEFLCSTEEPQFADGCSPSNLSIKPTGRVVFIGWSDPQNPIESKFMPSALGDLAASEIQALQFLNFYSQELYQLVPVICRIAIVSVGGLLIGGIVSGRFLRLRNANRRQILWALLSVPELFAMYVVLIGAAMVSGYVLPIVTPLAAWSITALAMGTIQLVQRQKQLLQAKEIQVRAEQQQLHMAQQQTATQEAIIRQVGKRLHRLASDIHNQPLQQLRLGMDRLELLALKQVATADIESSLEKLDLANQGIRHTLAELRGFARKVNLKSVTPELSQGLEHGIRRYVSKLEENATLQLLCEFRLESLVEDNSNVTWLDMREDIFRCFQEAVANVARHAQPPHGSATRLTIGLVCQEGRCDLSVANDGSFDEDAIATSHYGHGSRLMKTLMSDLPGGSWERVLTTDGGVTVRLSWQHP